MTIIRQKQFLKLLLKALKEAIKIEHDEIPSTKGVYNWQVKTFLNVHLMIV